MQHPTSEWLDRLACIWGNKTYKDVQILLEAESTTLPTIFGVCCNKGNKGRVETRLVDAFENTFMGTITYPFLTTLAESMIFRLFPFGGTSWLSVPWKLFLNARLRGNTVIRVIDSGSNPANQETGVVSASRDHPVCLVHEFLRKKLLHSCWVPPCATGTTEDM